MTHPAQQLDQWTLWAETNPAKCPCRGSGWLLSDWDSWHRCGLHSAGSRHPECDPEDGDEGFDHEARFLGLLRTAYASFQSASGRSPSDFRVLAAAELTSDSPTPQDWVDAAEGVAFHILHEAEEAQARAQGYSCAMEARWDEEAQREAFERGGY